MLVQYKNKQLERVLIGVNALAAAVVTASFVMLFGFHDPLIHAPILYAVQAVLLFIFIAEKIIRSLNAITIKESVSVKEGKKGKL